MDTIHTEEYKGYRIDIVFDYDCTSPEEWGNYEIVQFCDSYYRSYRNINNYLTENGKLLPEYQAKLRAGKMFIFTYNSYSSSDGGFYRYPTVELPDNHEDIDGFIIFDDAYIKNTTFEDRQKYAEQDLSEYTSWANGECYGYRVIKEEKCNLHYIHDEIVDSCYSFIGDYKYPIEDAKSVIDSLVEAEVTA